MQLFNTLSGYVENGTGLTSTILGSASAIREEAAAWEDIAGEQENVKVMEINNPETNGVPQTEQAAPKYLGWIAVGVGSLLLMVIAFLIGKK